VDPSKARKNSGYEKQQTGRAMIVLRWSSKNHLEGIDGFRPGLSAVDFGKLQPVPSDNCSSSSIIFLMKSNPPCQNAGDVTSNPASLRIFIGDSDPPYDRIFRYLGTKVSPSRRYC